MITFESAPAMLAKSRLSKTSKKLENNTWLEVTEHGEYAIKLHQTRIITIHSDGTYTLNSGGYRTSTTKDRLNGYAPGPRINTEKGLWHYGSHLFFDGMTVDERGNVLNAPLVDDDLMITAKSTVDKAVAKYIKGYLNAAVNGKLGGDNLLIECFEDDSPQEALMALWKEIRAPKYPENLIEVAVGEVGYNDTSYVLKWIYDDLKRDRVSHMLETAIRRYFMKRKLALTEVAMGLNPSTAEAVKNYERSTGYAR